MTPSTLRSKGRGEYLDLYVRLISRWLEIEPVNQEAQTSNHLPNLEIACVSLVTM